MVHRQTCALLKKIFSIYPAASAEIQGDEKHPKIQGYVHFYELQGQTVVMAAISGLPYTPGPCEDSFFGFHIHEGASCTGTIEEPFLHAGAHYNPKGCPHPQHAGDLPVLTASKGVAFTVFLTGRFTAREAVGKTIIIHELPDDYRSQPSGDSGGKIACGEIR